MTKTIFKVKIERKTHELDATGQSVGRLASQIALLLTGKNKVDYLPQVDNGDFVIVTNPNKIKLTGKKLQQKKYYSHSGHPGGLKVKKINALIKENPEEIVRHAVLRMLPKNRLQPLMIKRLMFK